ncbi:MAG: hypothetical protein LBP68_06750 [Acidobacteriota bacterium]|jgi:predicted transcriptional regulator|nr:hypothetical protein [Acidobacteriota bacterium]
MKTAISIDDELFHAAETFARTIGLSRSRLYAVAVDEYMKHHLPDTITERLNQYFDSHPAMVDEGLQQAAYDLFAKEDW